MELDTIETKILSLTNRIRAINTWIKENPHITDPNVYEIMDCNIQYAEVLAEMKEYYDATEYPTLEGNGETKQASSYDFTKIHPSLADCNSELVEMDVLRDTEHHPFFNQPEAKKMYQAIKQSQVDCSYEIPEDADMRAIKKELLCKSMSVPFYIWQVKHTEPDYKYDNEMEFMYQMKVMLDLYKEDAQEESPEKAQFESEIIQLFDRINADYKYAKAIEVENVPAK